MSTTEYLRLAQSLPPQLLRFFHRFPPQPATLNVLSASTSSTSASNTPTSLPTTSESNDTTTTTSIPQSSPIDSSSSSLSAPILIPSTAPNPFHTHRNPHTQKIHSPLYSLRRQANLYKLARTYKVADLLPASSKDPEERTRRRVETGLRVKGTGVGQLVRGKKWERMLSTKLEKRRQAMIKMPELVTKWKRVSFLFFKSLFFPPSFRGVSAAST